MPNPVRVLGVAASVGFLAMLSLSPEAPAAKQRPAGPEKLAAMLARYDAMSPGDARESFAREIDKFAGQRYATTSRLYWHTTLEDAKAAAAAQHQPILHLRMLGRLDEDLSCANSRFFRTTLYANVETSKFLRDNFVLYWSSERAVPRVTIDFGDGRKLERTTTGNSAHYVMDERGNVLDVLPGLYAPVVFRSELQKSVKLAKAIQQLADSEVLGAVLAFHETELRTSQTTFAGMAGTDYVRRRGRLIGAAEIGTAAVERAQRSTYAKMAVEVVDLQKIGIAAGKIDRGDVAQWATIGQKAWDIGLTPTNAPTRLRRADEPAPMLLDAQSIALIEKMRDGNPLAMKSGSLLARLEQNILADSALNQFQLRPQIRYQLMTRDSLDFATLNATIYATVFHTPKDDPWIGLLDQTDFTGLLADGVVLP
ncbi:MAG: hypothetical protein H0T65_00235 [Deltaproteobacteria bacterium]|nr:hypothetical protein [Deltaproteobacteria bacterium]